MATGGGLPIPKSGELVQQGQVINADSYSSAQAWTKIAAAGAELAKTGSDWAAREQHQRQVGYLAEQETEIVRRHHELRDEYARDPKGFDAAWKGYQDGKLGSAEPWAVPQLRRVLGANGNSAYAAILNEKRSFDHSQDVQRMDALHTQAASELIGGAQAGTLVKDDPRLIKYRGVLDTAVTSGLMVREKADLLLDDTMSRAWGETAARSGVEVYKEKGYEAAVDHLRKDILENEALTMKGEGKRKAFNRGLEAINLQRRVDREDRVGIVQDAKDLVDRFKSNQQVEPGTVRDTLGALKRVGAWSAYKDLYIEQRVSEEMRGWRSGNQRPAEIARTIGAVRERELASSQPAQAAKAFFLARGYSDAQAAGIVGNLIQENPSFNPAQPHDGGTGIGLAGWRLERRTALEAFAKARGKPVTDFTTQLEFIDHELKTSEPTAMEALRKAQTPGEAAAAFLHFERPKGYTAANPLGGHGADARVRYAQAVAGTAVDASSEFGGSIVRRMQTEFAGQMRKEWPDFKKAIDAGKAVDPEDFNAVRMAAAVSGDAAWIKDVEDAYSARVIGKVITAAPVGQQQAALDEVKQKANAQVASSVEAQLTRHLKLVTEDQVGYSVETGRAPPAPLTFDNPNATRAAVQERVNIVRAVAQEKGVAPSSPFRAPEVAAVAGAIASGTPAQAAAALDAIGSLPDDLLVPALKNQDIRAAITGAARAADPAKFNAAMTFSDQLWRRDPATAKDVLGEDTVHQLMTWQTNLRYMTPEQLAKAREKSALDPQARERRKFLEGEGEKLARKIDTADVVKQFDTSWGITPGPIARATGSQPLPPTDQRTVDAMMGDWTKLYARRYAETNGDEAAAAEQATALMKTKWKRSQVNGGQLMLRAPEGEYPAVNGTWDWMNKQLETDLEARLGPRLPEGATGGAFQWDYAIVSDRQTEAEAQAKNRLSAGGDFQPFNANRGPSYVVVVKNNATGKTDVVQQPDGTPLRYSWDVNPEREADRARQESEREALRNYSSARDNPLRF